MDERTPQPLGNRTLGSAPKRRGRPPGSVSLTPEIQATIVGLLREGVFLHVATSIAGVSNRTVDDWIARGEGRHPSRAPTPKLRVFAREVRMARALVRIDAETRVFREKPKIWLRDSARSTEYDDGWTAPPRGRPRSEGRKVLKWMDELDGTEEREPHRRRGRPPGSVSLTDEIQRTIGAFTRAGAFPVCAAEAAGISRSAYFDWMARAEGRHRTRQGTPKLRRFAIEVRRAQADARAVAEARVLKDDPLHWLRYAARTEGEAIGWSQPRPGEEERGESDLRPGELLEIWAQELLGPSDGLDERPSGSADHGKETRG
jgi:hypothetical protein